MLTSRRWSRSICGLFRRVLYPLRASPSSALPPCPRHVSVLGELLRCVSDLGGHNRGPQRALGGSPAVEATKGGWISGCRCAAHKMFGHSPGWNLWGTFRRPLHFPMSDDEVSWYAREYRLHALGMEELPICLARAVPGSQRGLHGHSWGSGITRSMDLTLIFWDGRISQWYQCVAPIPGVQ
jgi:hypothetical protein